jgi:hypothetical protein
MVVARHRLGARPAIGDAHQPGDPPAAVPQAAAGASSACTRAAQALRFSSDHGDRALRFTLRNRP